MRAIDPQTEGALRAFLARLPADIAVERALLYGSRARDGAPQIMLEARLAVRELLGQIRLEPGTDGSQRAAYEVQPAVLVRGVVSGYAAEGFEPPPP